MSEEKKSSGSGPLGFVPGANSFLDQLGTIFDRRFIIAHGVPAIIGSGVVMAESVIYFGGEAVFRWWAGLSATEQTWLGVILISSPIVISFLLQFLMGSLLSLYGGNWPSCLRSLEESARETQKKILSDSREYSAKFYGFPREELFIGPTRLGNALTAAEEYAYQLYRLDSVLWWPRLNPLLPDTFRTEVDAAFASMVALVNLSFLLTGISFASGAIVAFTDHRWWLFVLIFIGGLLLARFSYLIAVSRAKDYGDIVRVAFDLYRHNILKQMRIPLPENSSDERVLWESLTFMMYHYRSPMETEMKEDLRYDNFRKESPQKPKKIELSVNFPRFWR